MITAPSVHKVESMPCPLCLAMVGQRCTQNGREVFYHHNARIQAAAGSNTRFKVRCDCGWSEVKDYIPSWCPACSGNEIYSEPVKEGK